MPNKTTNFNLDLPVGDDLFNPLWPNSNTSKIDAQMKKNQDNSVTKADCVFNTDKFIITREDKTGKIFKFTAPHDFVAGYTFTVDGTAMDGIVAGTGDALAEGCFMNGHEVIAYIDEATASLAFLVGSSLPDEIDATTLGGHAVDYFATAAGLAETNQVATSAGQVANQALEAAGAKIEKVWTNPDKTVYTNGTSATLNIPVPKALMLIVGTAALNLGNLEQCITIPVKKGEAGSYKFEVDFTINEQNKNNLRVYSSTVEFVTDGNTITQINIPETTRCMISSSGITNVSTGQSGIVFFEIWTLN